MKISENNFPKMKIFGNKISENDFLKIIHKSAFEVFLLQGLIFTASKKLATKKCNPYNYNSFKKNKTEKLSPKAKKYRKPRRKPAP